MLMREGSVGVGGALLCLLIGERSSVAKSDGAAEANFNFCLQKDAEEFLFLLCATFDCVFPNGEYTGGAHVAISVSVW